LRRGTHFGLHWVRKITMLQAELALRGNRFLA
jgi:hypothetical protein